MKRNIKSILKNKKYSITIILVLFFTYISITYAYFTASNIGTSESDINVDVANRHQLIFSNSEEILIDAGYYNFSQNMGTLSESSISTATLIAGKENDTATEYYNVLLDITSNNFEYTTEESKPELVVTITNPEGDIVEEAEGLEYVEVTDNITGDIIKGFDVTEVSGMFTISTNYEISSNDDIDGTKQNWEFTISFINLDTNQNNNSEKEMSALLLLTEGEKPEITLKQSDDINIIEGTNKEITDYIEVSYGKSSGTVVCNPNNTGDLILGNNDITCTATNQNNMKSNISFMVKVLSIEDTITDFEYTGEIEELVIPYTGTYKVELWGAEGGRSIRDNSIRANGGSGAYTSGEIYLEKDSDIYFTVGSKPVDAKIKVNTPGGYNGGGIGLYDNHDDDTEGGGGGATDLRLSNQASSAEVSLNSRIMVAAGGSGSSNKFGGSAAGGLSSYKDNYSNPATQTTGYSFGIGQNGSFYTSNYPSSGAGGGYYGGYSTSGTGTGWDLPGSGGSSYISGHTGCVAITSENDRTPISGCLTGSADINCSKHYSSIIFSNTVMIDGAGYSWTNVKGSKVQMPTPSGSLYALGTGHTGNGYAKITYLGTN